MKKFVFRLETVLKVREEKEKAAQLELTRVRLEMEVIQRRIDALKQEEEAAEVLMREKKQRTFSAQELASGLQYLEGVRQQIVRMQDDLFRAANIVAQKQQLLSEAIKERKAIEKLKEQRRADWEKALRKEERKIADEQATIRYLNRK